jgi:potassium channel subfamily K, other eukaryote
MSNSGKPFFVFWTLLAVPTLTIMISHMGDTVIKSFADLTIWAASLTILPHEEGFSKALKLFVRRISRGGPVDPSEMRFDKPPGFIPFSSKKDFETKQAESTQQQILDRLAGHVEDDEIEDARNAGKEGDTFTRDLHLYHYVLIRELKTIALNERKEPHMKYPYHEWAWYLKLLRQDEADPANHRKPEAKPKAKEKKQLGVGDGSEETLQWSWLGVRSPLLSTRTESEWLLTRLAEALENEMRDLRLNRSQQPPISMENLLQRMDEKGERNNSSTNEDSKSKDGSSRRQADIEKMES